MISLAIIAMIGHQAEEEEIFTMQDAVFTGLDTC